MTRLLRSFRWELLGIVATIAFLACNRAALIGFRDEFREFVVRRTEYRYRSTDAQRDFNAVRDEIGLPRRPVTSQPAD